MSAGGLRAWEGRGKLIEMSVRINNVLEYQGAAMPVFSLAPSWRASPGFSARAEAETVVSESLSGAEFRAQRRPRPFWRLRYEAISHDARESGYARRVVQLGADLPVAVPYWPHRVELTAAAAGEATSISHEDTGDTIWPDARYALIWEDALNWEVVEIDGEAGATVTSLASALEGSWPAGAALVPLLVGHFERGAGATHETDELGVWMVDFRESPVEALGVTEVGIQECVFDLDGSAEVAWLIFVPDLQIGLDPAIRPSCGVSDFTVTVTDNSPPTVVYFADDESEGEHSDVIPGWGIDGIRVTDNTP